MVKCVMDIGRFGEDKATEYLVSNGYTILCRNFRWQGGEIDIVASDRTKPGLIVFIEVKTRQTKSFGLPCEAVTASKMRKIKRTIKVYTSIKRCIGSDFRIDVIEVLLLNKKVYIRHLKNI